MPANGYFGVEFAEELQVTKTKINIGAEDFPEWAKIEYSADGNIWKEYEGKANDKGDWTSGKIEDKVRYIRLINKSAKEQECYLRAFETKVN